MKTATGLTCPVPGQAPDFRPCYPSAGTGCDLIIVRVDPVNRSEAPRSVRDIYNRSVEISHNATFWLELGALAVVLRFVDEGRSPFGRVRFHVMEASSVMERFPNVEQA